MSKNLKQSTINAASWNFSNMLVGQVRTFIVSTILARLLMPEDFGLLGMAMVFASLTDSFVDFGFGNAVIQKQKVSRLQLSTVFWINMLMALFLGLAMYFSSPLVAAYFEMPKLEAITQLMSLTFLIKGLSTLQNALYKKELDFKTPFKIALFAGIVSGVLGIVLAYSGYGVYSLIYSQIAGWVMGTALIWCFSKWKPSFLFKISEVKDLWSFGYKYSLSIFIDSIFSRLDTLIIGKLFSAATLGLFYKAQSLNKLVVQYAFSSFSGVLFPSLSKLAHDKEKLREVLIRILHLVCFTTFLFSGLMFINAKSVIVILLTEKWLGSVPIFKILALFSFIYTIPTILNSPILSIGKSGAILKVEMYKKSLYLLAIPVAIYYGLYAYILTTVFAAIIGIVLNLGLVQKFFNYRIIDFFKLFLNYVLIFLLLVAIDYFLGNIQINYFISVIVKSLIYVTLYVFLNSLVFKTEGFKEFKNIIQGFLIKLKISK
ncbi:O-antigen/teichoic acid export membrane protein [Winogradskyella pacifica]|uniref:O-antigen/teichoic acid export membrane protein n=1 Tax=Winogradskyella pacifica TaxID=664642 RepID=A0A3D9N5U0_9FLAO|nr:lipopolysaccharide biosynthesis protein [Winogradskyella pacifica]REE27454.1 O-antigen/teichoic acid export membrane protein [Winogradskyella pacifica]